MRWRLFISILASVSAGLRSPPCSDEAVDWIVAIPPSASFSEKCANIAVTFFQRLRTLGVEGEHRVTSVNPVHNDLPIATDKHYLAPLAGEAISRPDFFLTEDEVPPSASRYVSAYEAFVYPFEEHSRTPQLDESTKKIILYFDGGPAKFCTDDSDACPYGNALTIMTNRLQSIGAVVIFIRMSSDSWKNTNEELLEEDNNLAAARINGLKISRVQLFDDIPSEKAVDHIFDALETECVSPVKSFADHVELFQAFGECVMKIDWVIVVSDVPRGHTKNGWLANVQTALKMIANDIGASHLWKVILDDDSADLPFRTGAKKIWLKIHDSDGSNTLKLGGNMDTSIYLDISVAQGKLNSPRPLKKTGEDSLRMDLKESPHKTSYHYLIRALLPYCTI